MEKDTRRQRGRWSAEQKRSLVQQWESSGLTAREFAEQTGLPTTNLWRWRKACAARSAGRAPREAITFAPVAISGGSAVVRADRVENQRLALEIALDPGVRIRVFSGADMGTVSDLVGALSRRLSC